MQQLLGDTPGKEMSSDRGPHGSSTELGEGDLQQAALPVLASDLAEVSFTFVAAVLVDAQDLQPSLVTDAPETPTARAPEDALGAPVDPHAETGRTSAWPG